MADTRLNPDKINWESALQEMRNEKMSDDDIHKEIASEFGTTIADQQLGRGKFAKEDTSGLEQGTYWPKEWEKVSGNIPWESAALVAAGGAIGKYGPAALDRTKSTINKVHGSLRDLMSTKASDEGLLASQQAEKAIKQAEMSAKEATALQTPTTETPLDTKVKPLQPVEGKIVEQGVANTELKAAGQQIAAAEKTMAEGVAKGLPEPTLTTGTGKPAYEGQAKPGKIKSSYAQPSDIPKGYAWVPNAQYVDVHRQDLGQPLYTQEFKNRPFSETYTGSPSAAVEVNRDINRSVGRMTREEALAKGVPPKEIGEPTKGIFERIGGNPKASKAVKVAGIVGAVTAIPNLVHAAQGAQEKDVQKSFGSLVEGAGQLLGPIGAIASGIYGISPEELETVRKAEKDKKQAASVGSGRGIAPPAAYQR